MLHMFSNLLTVERKRVNWNIIFGNVLFVNIIFYSRDITYIENLKVFLKLCMFFNYVSQLCRYNLKMNEDVDMIWYDDSFFNLKNIKFSITKFYKEHYSSFTVRNFFNNIIFCHFVYFYRISYPSLIYKTFETHCIYSI